MSDPIRIIIVGKKATVAQAAQAVLKPDFEAVHVSISLETALSELPLVLDGRTPNSGFENASARNAKKKPAAVLLGGGLIDDEIAELRNACAGKSTIPWMRRDLSITKPPPDSPAYAQSIGDRVKTLWKRMGENGALGMDGLHYY